METKAATPNLTFLELAKKVLREEKRPLSPSEIWKVAVTKGYDSRIKSRGGKTPGSTLYAAIFLDEKGNPESAFQKFGDRPARYYLRELVKQPGDLQKAASTPIVPPESSSNYKESQLHPYLAYFVHLKFSAYSKTIRHNTSGKNEFGEWVHPDVIAVFYPDWRDELLDLSRAMGSINAKLYSFEIKKKLSFLNLREAFFQAVSNSSWAHEGYLVAAEIVTDEDFRDELRRLSASFGIGIIELDIEDPNSSSVLIPARERDSLDWDALNKLAMNKDVVELLKRIKNDLQTTEIRKEEYDKVLQPDELISSIRTKTQGY
jgi:hypothetical protein